MMKEAFDDCFDEFIYKIPYPFPDNIGLFKIYGDISLEFSEG